MDIRKLSLAAAAIAVIAPSISNANPETIALNACARAFASSVAAPGSAAPAYKVAYRGGEAASALAAYYNREYTFYLAARSPKTGVTFARATCSADTSGKIVALTSEPSATSSATLAARF